MESASYLGSTLELRLRVERFLADGSANSDNQQWIVPIVVGTPTHPKVEAPHLKALLTEPLTLLRIEGINAADWISVHLIKTI